MSMTNYERVGRALELLKVGLGPFVQREMENVYQDQARSEAIQILGEGRYLQVSQFRIWMHHPS
jgi:hypothetical protein